MTDMDEQLALSMQQEEFEEKSPETKAVEIEPGVWKTPDGQIELELSKETVYKLDQVMQENGLKDHSETLMFLMDHAQKGMKEKGVNTLDELMDIQKST